jgi:MarR family transcriptional regulator, lower aerobic nicotinate degradation pathway regulator
MNVMVDNGLRASGPGPVGLPDLLTGNTAFLLSWVARSADRRFHRALEAHDLTAHQLGVLSTLRGGPLVQSRISEQLDIFKPAMVALVNQLEAKGLVERRPHPTDRRAVEVHALPAAHDRLAAVDEDLAGVADDLLAPLADDDRALLHDLLGRLAAHPTEDDE